MAEQDLGEAHVPVHRHEEIGELDESDLIEDPAAEAIGERGLGFGSDGRESELAVPDRHLAGVDGLCKADQACVERCTERRNVVLGPLRHAERGVSLPAGRLPLRRRDQ